MRTQPQTQLTPEFQELQRRVRSLLEQLGNPALTTLAKQHGLGHDFIRDLVNATPRKKSISSTNLPKLATALRCDVEYLTLAQTEPRRPRTPRRAHEAAAPQPIPFGGFCEAGVWRATTETPRGIEEKLERLVIPQAPGEELSAYIMRGDSMAGAGVTDGMILVAAPRQHYAAGDFVIVRRTMEGLTELSLRRLAAYAKAEPVLEFIPSEGANAPIDPFAGRGQEAIEAAVRTAVRVF